MCNISRVYAGGRDVMPQPRVRLVLESLETGMVVDRYNCPAGMIPDRGDIVSLSGVESLACTPGGWKREEFYYAKERRIDLSDTGADTVTVVLISMGEIGKEAAKKYGK